ncbi:MAG: NAD-dependent epimerase/dehydratase family protein [Chlamydiae bacterium]|nr:NAD-dependent epimerase/dehydratase family protein [Chlamydiota bacterium]
MKNIFVTGASGFIGFHLCLYLKKQNYFVIGLDNFNHYYDVNLKLSRQKILLENGIEVINGDINNEELLDKILKDNAITHVVHLAAQAGVRHSLLQPQDYVSSNLKGFVCILEALKKHPAKLVFASSSSVYGLNQKVPFSTEDQTDHQTNLYGATKKANESLAFAYHHIYKIPMVGLRYFTVYGPFGRPDMAYFQFTKSILEEKTIEIFNNGALQRDFTYIEDIVKGTAAALDLNADFEIFNLGNNKPVELLKFISILEEKLNKKAIKKFLPMQKGEMLVTAADISKSKNMLNFHPQTSIEEGLGHFVKWYKEYYSSF